jgi:hypothetical protein
LGFVRSLAFLADLTSHLNVLNLNLQSKGLNISQLVGHIEGFRKKLKLFEDALQKNDTIHFPSCQKLKESENYFIDFAEFLQSNPFFQSKKSPEEFGKCCLKRSFPSSETPPLKCCLY